MHPILEMPTKKLHSRYGWAFFRMDESRWVVENPNGVKIPAINYKPGIIVNAEEAKKAYDGISDS